MLLLTLFTIRLSGLEYLRHRSGAKEHYDTTTSLTILGATGSVGKSTLELVREQPSRFAIKGLTAHTNYRDLARLRIKQIMPSSLMKILSASEKAFWVQILPFIRKSSFICFSCRTADCVVGAIVGIAGLSPVYSAVQQVRKLRLQTRRRIAAGRVIQSMLAKTGASILPLDLNTMLFFNV